MLEIIKKIYSRGLVWLIARLKISFLSPATTLGINIKLFLYYLFHPIMFLQLQFLKRSKKNKNEDQILHVIYDLTFASISYDFAFFLAAAEAYGNMHLVTKIHLTIIKPKTGVSASHNWTEYLSSVSIESMDWRINHMLIPIITISPSVVSYSVVPNSSSIAIQASNNLVFPEGYGDLHNPIPHYDYVFRMLGEHDFHGFHPSEQAKIYVKQWLASKKITSKIISITIRDYKYDASRNSAFQSWVDFADYLEKDGYSVIFIPDLENCWDDKYKEIKQYSFSEICWNLELRTAFYELCELNYFYSSGISTLALLNKKTKVINMFPLLDDSNETTSDRLKSFKLEKNKKPFKYTQPNQWTVFRSDDYKNLVEDFVKYKKLHLSE